MPAQARCTEATGTIHGTEIFAVSCRDVSRVRAATIAEVARTV